MKVTKDIKRYITAAILMLFIGISSVFAQEIQQYGTRISDTKTGKSLRENVILELDSKEKGFMLPRVTTAQRDRLVKNKTADNGLAIYNIDIDCVEFWSERTEKWMSVCGSLPPAKLDLANGSCSKITFTGIEHEGVKDVWQQGKALKENMYMLIEVKVESIGSYQISAATDNGYFFSGEGQFQSIGTYNISLKAMGTPINGYVSTSGKTGDNFKFTFNGIESAGCPNVQLTIVPADLDFTIKPTQSNTYVAQGTYIVKKEAKLRDGHKIEVDINVTSPGRAVVTATSNTDLGMKFMGSVQADANGPYSVVLEPVSGENMPKTNINTSYDLTFSTNTKNQAASINSQKASIVISETKIEPLGSKATLGNTKYYAGEVLTTNHTISLPIKVTAAGTTTLRLKDQTGNYEFIAENVVLDNQVQPTDEQVVVFKAKSLVALPATAGDLELDLSGDLTRLIISGTDKKVKIPITVKPVEYVIQCNSFSTNRTSIPLNVVLQPETFVITVKVDVVVPGEYEIKTSVPVDGLEFSSNKNGVKQKFTRAGANQEVKLYVVGTDNKATNKGTVNVQLVSNDANKAAPCSNIYPLKVGFKDLKVLVLRNDNVHDESRIVAYLKGGNRFSPTGTVLETGGFDVVEVLLNESEDYRDPPVIARLKPYAADVKKGVYDLIILDNSSTFSDGISNEMIDAIYEFITVKKGSVIIGLDAGFSDGSGYWGSVISNWGHPGNDHALAMLKKLNNNKMPEEESATSVKGFLAPNNKYAQATKKYPYTPGRTIIWYQSQYMTAMRTEGTNFISMLNLGSETRDAALVVRHKDYRLVLMMVLESTNNRSVLDEKYHVNSKNEILPNSSDGQGDAGNFMGNVLVNMITELLND